MNTHRAAVIRADATVLYLRARKASSNGAWCALMAVSIMLFGYIIAWDKGDYSYFHNLVIPGLLAGVDLGFTMESKRLFAEAARLDRRFDAMLAETSK